MKIQIEKATCFKPFKIAVTIHNKEEADEIFNLLEQFNNLSLSYIERKFLNDMKDSLLEGQHIKI